MKLKNLRLPMRRARREHTRGIVNDDDASSSIDSLDFCFDVCLLAVPVPANWILFTIVSRLCPKETETENKDSRIVVILRSRRRVVYLCKPRQCSIVGSRFVVPARTLRIAAVRAVAGRGSLLPPACTTS